ncbi:hypothetical protein HY492_01700 [Candidatus Woesearchaeota archaeon]|nr:hypothetical protein [Candidatus Woesearchaeota archaeon]
MTNRGVDNSVLKLLHDSAKPLSTLDIANKLHFAWHTVDRHCLKLQLKQKIDCFTIGKATAWYEKR